MTRDDIRVGQVWEWRDSSQFKIINITEEGYIHWLDVNCGFNQITNSSYKIETLLESHDLGYCFLINKPMYKMDKFKFV